MRTWLLAMALAVAPVAAPSTRAADAPDPAQAKVDSLWPTDVDGIVRGLGIMKKPAAAAPAAATAPGAPAAAPPQPAPETGEAAISLPVQFRSGSAALTPEAVRTLDMLGRALADPRLAGLRFRVEGHTDTTGSPALNQALSEQRARAVVAYLGTHFDVPADRLEPVGMGEAGLAVATGPQVAEPRNRRVRIVRLGA